MQVSMTEAVLASTVGGIAGMGPFPPGPFPPGPAPGPAPGPPAPVFVYDMMIGGFATVAGVAQLCVGGMDRALIANTLLHNESFFPMGAPPPTWGNPRLAIVHDVGGAFNYYLHNIGDEYGIVGSSAFPAWNPDGVFPVGGSCLDGCPFKPGALDGRMLLINGNGFVPTDVYFDIGGGFVAWNSGALPANYSQVYGTWINGYALLVNAAMPDSLYQSLAPGAAWNVVNALGAGGLYLPGSLCSSIDDKLNVYVLTNDFWGFMGADALFRWSTDEGQTWGSDPFAGFIDPGFSPSRMVASGAAGNGLLVIAGTKAGMGMIGTLAEATLAWNIRYTAPNPGDSIVDMWWDENTGRIWALVAPAAGDPTIIISDDQGVTWADWYNGPLFGAAVGGVPVSIGFPQQFR